MTTQQDDEAGAWVSNQSTTLLHGQNLDIILVRMNSVQIFYLFWACLRFDGVTLLVKKVPVRNPHTHSIAVASSCNVVGIASEALEVLRE